MRDDDAGADGIDRGRCDERHADDGKPGRAVQLIGGEAQLDVLRLLGPDGDQLLFVLNPN